MTAGNNPFPRVSNSPGVACAGPGCRMAGRAQHPFGPLSVLLAKILAALLYAYLGVGVLVATWMHAGGLKRVDTAAARGTFGFRVLITPGLILLWPLILMRAIGAAGHPPVECGPHRDAAKGDAA